MDRRGFERDVAHREAAEVARKAMTPAEAWLWARLRRNQLGLHFRRQQIIAGFRPDFYCHAVRLVVEVDGGIHKSTVERDAERDALLAARGIKVIRFTNDEVMNDTERVLSEIASITQERLHGRGGSAE